MEKSPDMLDFPIPRSALLMAAVLLGCGGSTELRPAPPEEITRSVTDPTGDLFGGMSWDLTAFSITRDADGITVRLDLSAPVVSPTGGDANALIGFVDFDVDQNASTGIKPTADEYRPNQGSTGMGADYQLALTSYDANGAVAVTDAQGHETGRVKPEFAGSRVSVRIPRALLGGDDGFLKVAAVVGAGNRPSDIAPENGSLTVAR